MEIPEGITYETIRAGQVGPYKDSVHKFKVTSDLPEAEVKRFCTETLMRSNNQSNSGCYNGSCGFPFGLSSYFRFVKLEEGVYEYMVCQPYCD